MPKAGERKPRPDDDHWMLAFWAKRERHVLAIERRPCHENPAYFEYRIVCTCGWTSLPTQTEPGIGVVEECAVWSTLDSRARRLEGDARERMNWTDYERRTQQRSDQRWERTP